MANTMPIHDKAKRIHSIWAVLLLVGYPLAILLPFVDAFVFKHVPLTTEVHFEFIAALLSAASILFGFTSLIIISKEWVESIVWPVLVPPLVMIILSGVAISNLAIGYQNGVETLLLSSATFNANVVSTGLVVGYVMQKMMVQTKKEHDIA
jgi:hypothetical protein